MKLEPLFQGLLPKKPPVWFMRQAGRYLPEYRAIRSKFTNFLEMCSREDVAADITMHPIRRFDVDAAIIFSDILVIPPALGQDVVFNPSPILGPLPHQLTLREHAFEPVFNTIRLVRAELPSCKSLIGFAGAPWTLLCYMIQGSRDQADLPFQSVVQIAKENPARFGSLLETVEHAVVTLLTGQVEAGCDVIQIFDSFAASVPKDKQEVWLVCPLMRILSKIREKCPAVAIIYFGRGVSSLYSRLHDLDPTLGFSMDQHAAIPNFNAVLQGNICPISLKEGTFHNDLKSLLSHMKRRPYIANLGHGILPKTPVEHVQSFIDIVRNF